MASDLIERPAQKKVGRGGRSKARNSTTGKAKKKLPGKQSPDDNRQEAGAKTRPSFSVRARARGLEEDVNTRIWRDAGG